MRFKLDRGLIYNILLQATPFPILVNRLGHFRFPSNMGRKKAPASLQPAGSSNRREVAGGANRRGRAQVAQIGRRSAIRQIQRSAGVLDPPAISWRRVGARVDRELRLRRPGQQQTIKFLRVACVAGGAIERPFYSPKIVRLREI